jgi:hypothetical protein
MGYQVLYVCRNAGIADQDDLISHGVLVESGAERSCGRMGTDEKKREAKEASCGAHKT